MPSTRPSILKTADRDRLLALIRDRQIGVPEDIGRVATPAGRLCGSGHRAVQALYAPMAKKVAMSGAGALISTTTDASTASRP
jgi:hypothetical protein